MPDAETTAAQWDALTYDGSAPGRHVPSLHIYLRPMERSGETPGTARRLFQDFISRFYSGPPFLTPAEKLNDTVTYALGEAARNDGTITLEKIQFAIVILDSAEGELHLFRNGPVLLRIPGRAEIPVGSGGFDTIIPGAVDEITLLDGTLPPEALESIDTSDERGRLLVGGSTAGIRIRLDVDGDRSDYMESNRAGPGTPVERPVYPPAEAPRVNTRPAAVPADEAEEREERRAPIRNPLLLASIFLLISTITFFWNRANRDRPTGVEFARTQTAERQAAPTTTPAGRDIAADGPAGEVVPAGTLLWEYMAGAAVTSSPCVTGDHVVVGSRDGNIYAFNFAGEESWRAAGPGGVGSSPVATGDRVIFGEYGGSVRKSSPRRPALTEFSTSDRSTRTSTRSMPPQARSCGHTPPAMRSGHHQGWRVRSW